MSNTTNQTIVAAFNTSADAQAAAADLQAAGISRSDIYLESSSATSSSPEATDSYASRSAHNEGGVVGWFKSLFGEEQSGEHAGYQNTLAKGGYLLSVDAAEAHLDTIEEILNRHNPVNVTSDDTTTYGNTTTGVGAYASPTATPAVGAVTAAGLGSDAGLRGTGTTDVTTGTGSIPVLEEDLQVGKRRVLRGGVRVFSRVVETPVEESIGLREEHVQVNRQTVNRPATEADFASGRNQAIEVEQYGEEAVVAKQARVVEEVNVGKEVTDRTETVKDSLRHTEVEVEQIPGEKTKIKHDRKVGSKGHVLIRARPLSLVFIPALSCVDGLCCLLPSCSFRRLSFRYFHRLQHCKHKLFIHKPVTGALEFVCDGSQCSGGEHFQDSGMNIILPACSWFIP